MPAAAARKQQSKPKSTPQPKPHLSMVPKEEAFYGEFGRDIETTPGIRSDAVLTVPAPDGAPVSTAVRLEISLPHRGWEITNGHSVTGRLYLKDASSVDENEDAEGVEVYLDNLETIGEALIKLGKEAKMLGLTAAEG